MLDAETHLKNEHHHDKVLIQAVLIMMVQRRSFVRFFVRSRVRSFVDGGGGGGTVPKRSPDRVPLAPGAPQAATHFGTAVRACP